MSIIYQVMGTTKQNIHQQIQRQLRFYAEVEILRSVVDQVRENHPSMGADILYKKLAPVMGRDRFRIWYQEEGLRIRSKKNWRRTTDSSGVIRFANHTINLELTGVNQLWVSDITYYEIDGRFYYLTFIMDQFSRKVKGYSVSRKLRTEETTIPALRMAIKNLSVNHKIIFHSDGGGQYYSKSFLALTEGRFINSMGKTAYENPYAERLNRTIKNDYVYHYNPSNFNQLKSMVNKAVWMYNEGKPHEGINGLTPNQFELMYIKQSVN